MDTIKHYSSFPATGVSLRQMVQFGEKPSTGMTVSALHVRSQLHKIGLSRPGVTQAIA